MFQRYEAKQWYHFAKIFTKFGDKLTKMNYISDNPKTNAALLTIEIEIMTQMALSNVVMISDFMDKYWNKHVEGKKRLDEEDKKQLMRLYRSLANITFLIWSDYGDK